MAYGPLYSGCMMGFVRPCSSALKGAQFAVCWQHSMNCLPAVQVQALFPSRAKEGVHDLAGSLPGAHDPASLIKVMTRFISRYIAALVDPTCCILGLIAGLSAALTSLLLCDGICRSDLHFSESGYALCC